MNKLLLKLQNYKIYKEWKNRISNKTIVDLEKGVGYYLNFPFGTRVGMIKTFDMKSGKRALYKLLEYEKFNDPDDMTKSSKWQFLGYEGEVGVNYMSFEQFLKFCNEQSVI